MPPIILRPGAITCPATYLFVFSSPAFFVQFRELLAVLGRPKEHHAKANGLYAASGSSDFRAGVKREGAPRDGSPGLAPVDGGSACQDFGYPQEASALQGVPGCAAARGVQRGRVGVHAGRDVGRLGPGTTVPPSSASAFPRATEAAIGP